jgi:S1-C subfamily serine protease
VPPLQPGDPGDGHGDDDRDQDEVGYVPPLPPEDRLWRHPSEVASGRAAPAPTATRPWTDRRAATLMLLSSMAGATLAVGAVALLGGFDDRVVERQVAVRTSVLGEEPNGFEAVAGSVGPSVAALVVHRGTEEVPASAVTLRSDGYLITDGPSVAGADRIDVALHSGQAGVARVVGVDEQTGIAVLHLERELHDAVRPDDADAVAVGARTIAVAASPDGGWDVTLSTGIVSAVGRRLKSDDGATHYGMILVDRPFARGAAGGALVDREGVVVGIVSGASATSGGASFGVATPIDLALRVADELVADGRVDHVWLGLNGSDLDADEAMALGVAGGALVEGTDEEGPARRAGIEPGDVVLSVDGHRTPTMSALIARLLRHVPGDVVMLDVRRDGEHRQVEVTLATRR